MTLRTRFTLWHTGILLVALSVLAAVFNHEFNEDRRAMSSGQTPPDSPLVETGEFVLFSALPIMLLLLAGSAWFMRRFLAPVTRLTETAEQIQLHNLRTRIPTPGTGDELDRLTTVFNAMTARLDESFKRVREFTLNASHELKTPLTIITGALETALRDERQANPNRDLLAGLLDEVQRLVKIVDQLSLLSKLDSGQLPLTAEPVRLDELVRDSFADAQVLAGGKNLAVTLLRCDEVTVAGDRHRLRQLLLNLADNAIKYNQPMGRVTLSLAGKGNQVELQITNTGPGIQADHLPRVFDRFFRGDPAHGTEVEGCGLGLSIAKWIVKAHHGAIGIASAVNGETTVTVKLPLALEVGGDRPATF